MNAPKAPCDTNLSTFIEGNLERILERWEQFAKSILVAPHLDAVVLRDHAIGILRDIASDLKVVQTSLERKRTATASST